MLFGVRQNSATWSETMRLDSGRILINANTTSSYFDGQLNVAGNSSFKAVSGNSAFPIFAWNNATSGDNNFVYFLTETSATGRGSISYNRGAGLVAYNVTSDYRAKTIDGNIENAINTINSIKTHKATMNGATISMPMFVAHELAEVAPYCVTGKKDGVRTETYEISPAIPAEVDSDGKTIKEVVEAVMGEREVPIYQQVDSSPLIPLLVKAIQEQQVMIEELKAKVAALKAA